ncbi:MAG: peptidylprolyl isomerase, partial [Solobacterium sp.]|nr:peptidylprolyl isomerase [Solobacterium sp.]
MKRLLACLALVLAVGCSTAEPEAPEADTARVAIEIENYGTIVVELDAAAAPLTVENFLNLVDAGFYDGLTFHRIIEGFMMQGGDPEGNGFGGSGTTVHGEFSANGWDNPILHERGVISMAWSKQPDSASSQFFILQ